MNDTFNPAQFKAFAANLGIETRTVTDAFGRTDITIDRAGLECIRDAARAHGFNDIANTVEQLLAAH